MSNRVILEVVNLKQTFQNNLEETVPVLDEINLEIRKGEFVSFIGPSGCGKTTLLRLIAGLDVPKEGQLLFNQQNIIGTEANRGYVFQQGSLFPWLTVEKNIAFGLKAQKKYQKSANEVDEFIQLIGLAGFEKSFPHQISGGMAQRVAIARALINHPEILLLDEPMGALDSFTRIHLQDKLLELWEKKQATMLLVTHDIDEAIYLSNRIFIMTPRPGRVTQTIEVNIPQPRNRSSQEFTQLRNEILEILHLAHREVELSHDK